MNLYTHTITMLQHSTLAITPHGLSLLTHTHTDIYIWRWLWCDCYCHMNWTWQHEFKCSMRHCISYSANTLGKGINLTILPLAMGK